MKLNFPKEEAAYCIGQGIKTDDFLEKFQWGVIFNPKIYIADF